MSATSGYIRPTDLRLMPYGRANARSVKNGIWEPLWAGQRALVEVLGSDVGIRDEDGDPVEGYEPLRTAIREAAMATEVVLDGYLVPAPLRDTAGLESVPGLDAVPTAAEMGLMFVVGASGQSRRDEVDAERSRRMTVPAESGAAFVAVDMLWLDGEPLLDLPLAERKRLLDAVIMESEIVRRTVSVRDPVGAWFAQWRAQGFREVAVKGANSRYTPGKPHKEWATALIPRR